MYYSKSFNADAVLVKVTFKEETVFLSFEGVDFADVINMLDGEDYNSLKVSDIMYDMLVALDGDECGMVYNFEVIFSVNHPEWIGRKGEGV